jgi:glycine cleavage system protein P-like pyridoxal-binding family
VRPDGHPRRPRGLGQHEKRRKVLVPTSAHGTNPATAAFVGYTVVEVAQTEDGRVDVADLASKLGDDVAAIMVTNPNTCGLFERDILEISRLTHEAGAYFYCDGANFNAIVGRVRPGDLGVDAMHINLHKTFSTPHGGGGPGAGPVVLSEALAPSPRRRGSSMTTTAIRWSSGRRGRGRTGLRPSVRLPGPDGHVCPRPQLHDEPRLGRPASGRRGRRPERQLHQGPPVRT